MEKFFNNMDKFLLAVIWAVPGIIIGFIVRLFYWPTVFTSIEALLIQYLPWGLGFGLLFGILAYLSPKISALLLEILVGIGIGSQE